MALYVLGMPCPLCAKPLQEGQPIVATSHFIGDPHNPLYEYSDAAMHQSCFLTWDKQAEFVALFNQTVSPQTAGNGTYREMDENGIVRVYQRSNDDVKETS